MKQNLRITQEFKNHIRSNPFVKQAAYYLSRFIKMCDYKQILSIHISEATKVSLSMSSFSKPPNALHECGTIFRQCTHYLAHETGKRKGITSGRPGCIYSCWKTAFMQQVAPPFLSPTNPALDLLSTGGRYQEGEGEKQERENQYLCHQHTSSELYETSETERIYSHIYPSSVL